MCERLNETTSLLLTHKDEVSDYKWQTGDKILVLYFDDLGQEHLEVFEYFNYEFSNGKSNFQELDDECCVIAWEKIEAEAEPEKIDFRLLFNYLGSSSLALKYIDSQGRDGCYCGDIPLPTNENCLVVSSDGTVIEYNPKSKDKKITLVQAGEDLVELKKYREDDPVLMCESAAFNNVIDKVFVISGIEEMEAVYEFIEHKGWQKILRSYMPPMKYEWPIRIFMNSEGKRITGRNIK